jgi:FAD/FMN-containing dehydrogenase
MQNTICIVWLELAEEAAYKAARLSRVFNQRSPARFPQGIVKPSNESDIIAAIKLALQCNCRIAVRAGGHSFPVWSVQDHSILLDLGNFKVLEVDEAARTAKVSPSITSRALNDVLIEKHGLMFPGGHCPDVGLGGFLLQGGMGWNCRVCHISMILIKSLILSHSQNWGWACESVEAIQAVTMQGQTVFCNTQQNADLYWAARGAGPGMLSSSRALSVLAVVLGLKEMIQAFPAVVTEFHLRLIPYPKKGFRSSGYIYPRSRYRGAFSWVLEITPTVDTDTEITVVTRYIEGQEDVCVCLLSRLHEDYA